MRTRLLIVTGGLLALGVATPALANPVTIDDDGPCYNAAINGKNVLPNPICYLGPPPPK